MTRQSFRTHQGVSLRMRQRTACIVANGDGVAPAGQQLEGMTTDCRNKGAAILQVFANGISTVRHHEVVETTHVLKLLAGTPCAIRRGSHPATNPPVHGSGY